MFPGHPVVAVTADSRRQDPPTAGVVVATPGMEPVVPGGYSAAYLPDAHRDLWHADVRAAEQALRRWCNAAALVRPGAAVLVNADPGEEAVQALIRWDAAGFAARELRRREEESLPPAVRLVQLDAAAGDADRVVAAITAAVPDVRVLGPRPTGPDAVRVLLTAPDAAALVAQVRRAVVAGAGGPPVRVQVDPVELH
jgi:primosomal protein N' (replication factor Y)